MRTLRIGIDNYGLSPLGLSALETMQWAKENGGEGVHFSGLGFEESRRIDDAYLKDLAQFASSNNMYIEWGGGQHIPFDMRSWEKKDVFSINQKAAREAASIGTRIVRSCSGGLMRWDPESPMTETLLQETANALCSQRQMLRDYNVILAIETHFEFTTYELLRLFELCDTEPGDYLGICLDTMNLLIMLEDTMLATERILPWVVSSHVKDGAVLLAPEGFTSFPTEIGRGVIDIRKIAEQIASVPMKINLSVEDHGGSFSIPIFDPQFLSKFPDLEVKEFAYLIEMCHQSDDALKAGRLSVVDREEWPRICESRIKYDIRALKQMLRQ